MPLSPVVAAAIIGGGASIAGGVLANKSSQSTTPTLDPKFSPLQDSVLQMVQQRLSRPIDTAGYGANGVSQINRSFADTKQAQDNNLSARGLATSPIAGTVDATRENARAGATSGFLNTIPLLTRQLQGDDLTQANQILATGRGQSTTGSSGGGAGGAFTNLAGYMGYLQGSGAFKKAPGFLPSTSTVPPYGTLPDVNSGYGAGY